MVDGVEPLRVVEKMFTMEELTLSLADGRLVSVFIVGTAAFISQVSEIHFRGRDVHLDLAKGNAYVSLLRGWLRDIMDGNIAHGWAEVVEG
jgi:branched-chain amino acid aminotransferase